MNRLILVYYKWGIRILGKNQFSEKEILFGYVVSLTSFQQRINSVYMTILSILLGNVRPEKIVLYLSLEEFPNGLIDLPIELKQLQRLGLDIQFRDKNIKSHKKYLYAFKEYPNHKIITIDDDIIYPNDFLQRLFKLNYNLPNNSIIGFLAMRMEIENDNYVAYRKWDYLRSNETGSDILLIGCGGCLYNSPTELMSHHSEEIMQLFETGDDIYLHYLGKKSSMNNIVYGAEYPRIFPIIPWVQTNNLYEENIGGGKNDEMLRIMQRILQ